MTEISMRRDGVHLVPVDEVSAAQVREIPTTQDVLVAVKTPRNLRQFRLAWALAQKVSEAVDFLADRDDAMSWLKIKARHVTMLQDPSTGQVAIIPKSIAFASLGQDAFSRIFNRMIHVTCTDIISGLKEGDLRAELERMVGAEMPVSAGPVTDAPSAATQLQSAAENAPAASPRHQRRERELDRLAEVSPDQAAESASITPKEDATACVTAEQYIAYATHWIDTTTDTQFCAQGRWDNEMDTRDALKVPHHERARLQARIDARYAK